MGLADTILGNWNHMADSFRLTMFNYGVAFEPCRKSDFCGICREIDFV